MRLNQNRFRELLLLAGICGLLFFFRLGGFGLVGPDEPRYAQVAREMLSRHDWVTPVLYHHNWLEKPILLYWGEMLSYLAFGESDWAARVPSAVSATLLVFGTYVAVGKIRPAARLDAALITAASALVLGFGRAAATDMPLSAFFCLSLLAWYVWYHLRTTGGEDGNGNGAGRLWLYAFYVLNALAMLAKGPVAPALAAIIIIVFCLVRRDTRAILQSLSVVGIALFLLVAAPWYVLVQMRTPEFFRVFFLEHNLSRFGTNAFRHKQPFWYYVPVLIAATLPWTVWVLHGIGDGWRSFRRTWKREEQGDAAFELFLLVWGVIPVLFFSLSHSKLPGYILPAVPAFLVLAAVAIHTRARSEEPPRFYSIAAHAAFMGLLACATCLAPRVAFKFPASMQLLMLSAIVGTVTFAFVALMLLTRGWRMLRFVTLLPMILIVGFVLRSLAPSVDAYSSSRSVATLIERIGVPQSLEVATFSLNRNTTFGLGYYLDRPVIAYEGLEVSPGQYELPPAVPLHAHVVVAREGSLDSLQELLPGREVRLLGFFRPQHIEIYSVSAAR